MKAFIGIGSNIGDRIYNCLNAISKIDDVDGCFVVKSSSFYKTEPVGYKNQDWFINCAILVDTRFSPFKLLAQLKKIERIMGRKKTEVRWGPRLIDLDILMYENLIINRNNLIIPHPFMHKRRFVLIPMIEIAPYLVHPILKKRIKDILAGLSDEEQKVFLIRGNR